MRKFLLTAFITILFFLFPSSVSAQVVINEVNPSGEWIELFKTSPGAVSLEGCTLYFHNSTSTTQKKTLTISDNFLEDEAYKVISSGGSWLSNSDSDTVLLDCPSYDDGPHTYGEDLDTKSFARIPNGTGPFIVLSESSQGSINTSPPTTSPTPTTTPTPTATSTQTPTPTPTKTPTPIPTKTPTPKPSATSSPTSSPQVEVLGETTSAPTPTDSPTPIVGGMSVNKPPILAFVLVAVGVLLMGFSGYLSFKKMKETGV